MSEQITPQDQMLCVADRLILGVVTARRNGNEADASVLIHGYMEEARKAGLSANMAWAMLFSASTRWVDALIEHESVHTGRPPHVVITTLATSMAAQHG